MINVEKSNRLHQLEPTMTDAFCAHLLLEEKSPATIQKYLRDVKRFYCFQPGESFTKEDVIRYKQWLLERYAVRSAVSMLVALNRFLCFIGAEDCCVRPPRVQRQIFADEQKELSLAEYRKLLNTARERGQIRLYLVIQTLCATGIRVGELKDITLEAVQAGSAVVRNKGKTRVILLPRALCDSLLRYAESQGIYTGTIFVTRSGRPLDRSNIWTAMHRLCREAGVAEGKGFPHNLRHLFARSFYEQEKDITHLSDILGHSSINTTRIYVASSGARHRAQLEALRLAEDYHPQKYCEKEQHNDMLRSTK